MGGSGMKDQILYSQRGPYSVSEESELCSWSDPFIYLDKSLALSGPQSPHLYHEHFGLDILSILIFYSAIALGPKCVCDRLFSSTGNQEKEKMEKIWFGLAGRGKSG